jgi:hypothetical protein
MITRIASNTGSSATASPGQSLTITVPVTYAAGQLLDFEIHGPDGARLAAPNCCQSQVSTAAGTAASITYNVPAGAATGVYTVAVGVFSTDWSHFYSWNNTATTFTVGASAASSSTSSTSSSGATASSTAASGGATAGQTLTISMPVNYAAGQLIDFEVHGPDGARMPAPNCCQQQLPSAPGTSATITYAVPAGAAKGVYTVAVGVFSADWSHFYSWNNTATTFTVGSSGSSAGSTSNSASTTTSSSGGNASGGSSSGGSASGSSSSSAITNTSGGPAASLVAKLGKPNRLLLGLGAQGDADEIPAVISQNLKVDIYDRYLDGLGGGDWTTWNSPSGQYVLAQAGIADSINAIPMFVLYSLSPEVVGSYLASSNLQNASFMTRYWNNARLMFQKIAQYGKPALVNFEPDFWGFAQQQALAAGQDGAKTAAQVSVNPDCSSQPNNVIGIAGCLVQMARKYAPNAYVAFPPTDWGANGNIAQVVSFENEIGAGNADFIIAQTLDGDAGCYEAFAYQCTRGGTSYYWDESNTTSPNFNEYFARLNQYQQGIGNGRLPVLIWQNPEGVPSSTPGGYQHHFRDNREHYFLTHTSQLTASHVFAITFASGPNLTNITTDGGQYQTLSNSYFAQPAPLQ